MSGYVCLKLSPPPTCLSKHPRLPIPLVRNTLLGAALSFGLVFSFPSVSASQICRDVEPIQETLQTAPEVVTNEGLVEEAWQIVNDTFLDTGRHRWSQDTWQLKREAILSNSIQTRSKAHHIIKRMLSSLADPYTRFLSPDEFSKMARYDMTGVGINLKEVPDENGDLRLEVLGIILDGPAHSAGVRQGDEILAVNNMEVKGKSAFEVSSLLQGPNGTSVTIQVKHGNCGPVESIEVQRQLVARTPVFYRLEQLDNGVTSVGYIRLKEFNALARKDLAGIEIAKLFLNEGDTVIYTVGRDPQLQKAIVTDTSPLIQAPVVVASALHDNCRAVLVGKRTYGKGLIQSVFELDDGSGVVITVGKYVTPNHKDINGNGIEPDFQKLPAWDDISRHLKKCSMSQQG
ncbi:Carboxyl-terminal-processing peptidase 1, chloroplastic [Glycine max]|nr:Carboxyl-terminal-processing peptidase 1, chloroplastic [Glycine max]